MESKRQKSRSEERGPKENEGPEGPEEVAGAEVVFFSFSGSLSHGSLKNKKIKKNGGPRRGPGGPQKSQKRPSRRRSCLFGNRAAAYTGASILMSRGSGNRSPGTRRPLREGPRPARGPEKRWSKLARLVFCIFGLLWGPPGGGPGASRELLGAVPATLRASRARRRGSADRLGREKLRFSESGCRLHGSIDFEARGGRNGVPEAVK